MSVCRSAHIGAFGIRMKTELSRVHWRCIWCALYALAQCTSSRNSFSVLVYCSCHAPIMRRKPIYGNQMYVHCMETRRRRRQRTEFPFYSFFPRWNGFAYCFSMLWSMRSKLCVNWTWRSLPCRIYCRVAARGACTASTAVSIWLLLGECMWQM